jgi:hypothetical protein
MKPKITIDRRSVMGMRMRYRFARKMGLNLKVEDKTKCS